MARSGDDAAAPLPHAYPMRAEFTLQEPKVLALYEAVLDELGISAGTRLLEVACGPGLFLRLAAQRGAVVSGVDPEAPFIAIARERVPDAALVVGGIESLPFADRAFDVVTGFNAFQFSADPPRALREAARVADAGCPVVIGAWGRPEHCEAAAYLEAIGGSDAFALSQPAAMEAFAAAGGLVAGELRDVDCVWDYPDEETALRALGSTEWAVEAIGAVGEQQVTTAILESIAPYRAIDGGYRIENVFSYVISTKRTTTEEAGMAGVRKFDFEAPDETRTPDKTRVEVVRTGGATAARLVLEPGWKWSECVKPVAGTDRCQVHHVGFAQSGTIHVVHEDGTEIEIEPGSAYEILPGHDAWVVGDERCVMFEFESRAAEEYARG
jgi:SAM-dependent methyltransferase